MPRFRDENGMPSISNTFSTLAKDSNYVLGVLAQFLNVGGMVMCWTYIYQYAEGFGMDSVTTGYYQMGAFVLFAIGRAVGTYLLRFINSGKLLMSFALLAMLFVSGTILINGVIGLYTV